MEAMRTDNKLGLQMLAPSEGAGRLPASAIQGLKGQLLTRVQEMGSSLQSRLATASKRLDAMPTRQKKIACVTTGVLAGSLALGLVMSQRTLRISGPNWSQTPILSAGNNSTVWFNGDLTVTGTSNFPFTGLKVDVHPGGGASRIERYISFEGAELQRLEKALRRWGLDDVLKVKELGGGIVQITHRLTGEQFIGKWV